MNPLLAPAEAMSALPLLPQGIVFSPAELLSTPTRTQSKLFGQALRSGLLVRLAPGLYVATRLTRFGLVPPSETEVVASLRQRTGHAIVPTAASSANLLRLSTQVPMRPMYWTSGPDMDLKLGRLTITLRHQSAAWLLHDGAAGHALRAMDWMGESVALSSVRVLGQVLPAGWRQEALRLARLPGSGCPWWVTSALS